MKLIFIDDSVQDKPARTGLGTLVALGAVIVSDHQVGGFASDLLSIKTDLGVPADEEIKWKPPKGSFLAGAGGEAVKKLRERILIAAIDRGITSVVHVLDHGAVYTDKTVVEVGQTPLSWTYDKIRRCCRRPVAASRCQAAFWRTQMPEPTGTCQPLNPGCRARHGSRHPPMWTIALA